MTQGGELVVTQDAIDTIAGAYEDAAAELRRGAESFKRNYSRQRWGALPSIEQLRLGYQDLAIGESASAVSRMREFADAAEAFAEWVRSGGAAIHGQDRTTATDLTANAP